MASGALTMTTWGAKRVFGDDTSQNPGGALLQSGSGRADNSTTGDTWIFLDTLGGTTSYWGFKHSQEDNSIKFYGSGTLRSSIWLGESKITATTFEGNASTATNADKVDNEHASAFAHIAAHNNLTASGNEFTTASSGFSGTYWWNYRTAGGTNGNITQYNFGDGKGGVLASISSGAFSGNAASASRWATARTLTLTGSVTGSVSIDGSGSVSLATSTNHNHDSLYVPLSWMPFRSARDFPSGTLISTDLDGGAASTTLPFLLKIVGNAYGQAILEIYCSGYVYKLGNGYSTYINTSAISMGTVAPSKIYAYKDSSGHLAFWFENLGYWHGYDIQCWNVGENYNTTKTVNHVTSVTNTGLPSGRSYTTEIGVIRTLTTNNYSSYALPLSGGTLTGQLYIKYSADVATANKNGSLVIGNKDGLNIAIDDNEIMCRNNTSNNTLYLNDEGGTVQVGPGGLTIAGGALSANDHNGHLRISSTSTVTSGGYFSSISTMAPNVGNSQHLFMIGTSRGTKNAAYFGFHYSGSGSNDNYATIGLYSVDQVINIRANNCVGIGTTAPTYKLHVAGNIKADGGYLYITANGYTVQYGCQNGSFCHFTGGPQYYFDKTLHVNGNIYVYNTNTYMDANDIHASRYMYCNYINESCGTETPSTSSYWIYANSDGWLRKSTNAGVGAALTNQFLHYNGWANTGNGWSIDNGHGMMFCYANHGAPGTWGIVTTFDYSSDSAYRHQIFADCYNSEMYFRVRSADRGGWYGGWKRLVYNSGTWSINIQGVAHRAKGPEAAYVSGGTLNASAVTYALHGDYGSGGRTITNVPGGWSYGALLTIPMNPDYYNTSLSAQFIWDVQHNTNAAGRLWFRTNGARASGGTNNWKDWCEIATSYTPINWIYGQTHSSGYHFYTAGGQQRFEVSHSNTGWRIYMYSTATSCGLYSYDTAATPVGRRFVTRGSDGVKYFGKDAGDVADYAEGRHATIQEPGRCLIERGDGMLIPSSERLQTPAGIISDTWGYTQGVTEEDANDAVHISLAGRVLAYTYEPRDTFVVGEPVCTGPGGTVSRMTEEEAARYPWKIVGTVSEIPHREYLNDPADKSLSVTEIKNRILIKVSN